MKMTHRAMLLSASLLALGACGGGQNKGAQNEAQNSADLLRNAADQSTPQAREVLLNEAQKIEAGNVTAPPGAPGSPVQDAMKNAGAAASAPLPDPKGALPRQPGEQGPPKQTTPQP